MSEIESRKYEHMRIVKEAEMPKTSVFSVLDKYDLVLGTIRWWSGWRQYCFMPSANRVFSKGCMNDIVSFLDELKEERRRKRSE